MFRAPRSLSAIAIAIVIALLGACAAGSTPSPASPPGPPATDASTTPIDGPATPDAPPPVAARATIEHLLVAGPRDLAPIELALERATDALAACTVHADGSVAIEARFQIVGPDRVRTLRLSESVAPALAECIEAALPDDADVDPTAEPTFAYAVLAIDRIGAAPAERPAWPDVRIDFEATCSMFARSGAMARPVEERQEVARAYFHAHVRHPAMYRMAYEIATSNPADRADIPERYRRQIKPRRCEDPHW